MEAIADYQNQFSEFLNTYNVEREPKNLYQPIKYILNLGGKRLRPVLTLMTTACFDGDVDRSMDAALAVEVFHNFSLIHDDIMDAAPLRRGQETVHEKWDLNTGILSGDAMLIRAYQLFENYPPETFRELAKLFSKTALEVCEGQQYDIDFETRLQVSIPEYLKMIECKTAVLVGAAMQMGAIVANAPIEDQVRCYNFGKNLGIAFQLQDDYLDAFGNPEIFGKQVGGDILENKKTYLFLKAIENGSPEVRTELTQLFQNNALKPENKVSKTLELFVRSEANIATKAAISFYTKAAFDVLETINISGPNKQILKDFGTELMTRDV
ncbi:polyprenyl synthetase family protein [Flavobacteriaceae bacterium]|nr:polyprenyl synthetase family protein [Flavobacteriaceae bacterium]MDA9029928.1 polyprenyl synthetase family protein [Flavobacteriaceae bacterium]|tara:strand:- start:1896 stop:2870 length:975 start_codon:yes stop_codon:yes gene_type:complete